MGTLARTAADAGIRKTALVLVGDFLGSSYERSKLYDPEFETEFRRATPHVEPGTSAPAERPRQTVTLIGLGCGTPATVTAAVDHAAAQYPQAVLAVGNAPTALLRIAALIEKGLRPSLVIGVLVGFVNVVENKERLFAVCQEYDVPAIVAMGRKGGSTVAAAICNALIYTATDMLDPSARGWN